MKVQILKHNNEGLDPNKNEKTKVRILRQKNEGLDPKQKEKWRSGSYKRTEGPDPTNKQMMDWILKQQKRRSAS